MRHIFLKDLIKKCGLKVGAEIGVWYGATFFYLLDNCPELHLYGVDIWIDVPGLSHHKDQYQNMIYVLGKVHEYAGRGRIIGKPSLDAVRQFEDGSLDFVFIDADHSTESVSADIKVWLPKIRQGGFITGHDYDWATVRDAVAVELGKVRVYEPDWVWWVQV